VYRPLLRWLAVRAADGIERYVTSVKGPAVGSTVAQPMKLANELGEGQTMFAVVKMYTQDDVYGGANLLLRNVNLSSVTAAERSHPLWEFIVLLQVCLMTRPRVNGPIEVWRGIRGTMATIVAEYLAKLGKIVVWPPFTSTSLDPKVAEKFAGQNGVIFKIRVSAEAARIPALGLIDVHEMSQYPREQEILLTTSIPLRVMKVMKGRPRSVVFLEVDTSELHRLQHCLEHVWLKWRPGEIREVLPPRARQPKRSPRRSSGGWKSRKSTSRSRIHSRWTSSMEICRWIPSATRRTRSRRRQAGSRGLTRSRRWLC
jgi:hypothetical protein